MGSSHSAGNPPLLSCSGGTDPEGIIGGDIGQSNTLLAASPTGPWKVKCVKDRATPRKGNVALPPPQINEGLPPASFLRELTLKKPEIHGPVELPLRHAEPLVHGVSSARVCERRPATSGSVHILGASLPSRALGPPQLRGRVRMMVV